MVDGHPVPIDVGDLVVDPHERASVRPRRHGSGLPVEPVPLVLAFIRVGGLRPVNNRQGRQAELRCYVGVRRLLPGSGPDQLVAATTRPVTGV